MCEKYTFNDFSKKNLPGLKVYFIVNNKNHNLITLEKSTHTAIRSPWFKSQFCLLILCDLVLSLHRSALVYKRYMTTTRISMNCFASWNLNEFYSKEAWASQVAKWYRICLPVQETWV